MLYRSLFYLCAFVLITGCQLGNKAPVPVISATLDEPFTLHVGESARLSDVGMDITFVSVPTDGRCPTNINCAATLPVHVTLQIQYTGFSVTSQVALSAHTGTDGIVSANAPGVVPAAHFGSHRISLVSVTPYSDAKRQTNPNAYAVTLLVTKSVPETPLETPTVIAASADPLLGEEFDLRLGGSSILAEVEMGLSFDEVVVDSRCPADVSCVWSGVVNVRLTAAMPSQPAQSFIVGGVTDADGVVRGPVVEASGPTDWWYAGYTIALRRVTPYPAHASRQIPLEDYRVTLVVTAAPTVTPTVSAEILGTASPSFPSDPEGLPILCMSERALAELFAGASSQEPMRLTPPVAAATLVDKATATALCEDQFGEHFHVASVGDLTDTWVEFIPADMGYWLWDGDILAPVAAP